MNFDPRAVSLLERLNQRGFSAHLVGGCVRDALMGKAPHDYDVTTAALPQEIKAAFDDVSVIETGIRHGTVTVLWEGLTVEVTTHRVDGSYADGRHPDGVTFTDSLTEDLARRDFTVNAMAYSPTRGFADPFGGQKDLQDRILRAVGDPHLRFTEDALRILRGVRFAVRYSLTPEENTLHAMKILAHRMDFLAKERIFDELCKLLPLVSAEDLCRFAPILSAAIPELAPMIGFLQHTPHHAYDVFTHTAHVVAGTAANLTLRWAALGCAAPRCG